MIRSQRLLLGVRAAGRGRPLLLLGQTIGRMYHEIWLRPLAGRLVVVAAAAALLWFARGADAAPRWLAVGLWALALLPLAIALEEFFHMAACLGRGKGDRLQGLLIGRCLLGRLHLGFQFAAVVMQGRLNAIDRLYISAAGPLLAFCCLLAAWLGLQAAGGPAACRTAVAVVAAVPLIGLIPSRLIVESDGYSLLRAARRLRLPGRAIAVEVGRALGYALGWMLRPRRPWPDDFVDERAAYAAIEAHLATGDKAAAVDWYRRLARVDPYNSLIHNNLAWLLADLGQRDAAGRHAARALALAPHDPTVRDTCRRIWS